MSRVWNHGNKCVSLQFKPIPKMCFHKLNSHSKSKWTNNSLCVFILSVSGRSAPVFVHHFPASALFSQFITTKSTDWIRRTNRLWAGVRRPEEVMDWDHSVCTVGHSANNTGSLVAIFNLISSRLCGRKICQVCVCVCVSYFTVKVKEAGSHENPIQCEICLSVMQL